MLLVPTYLAVSSLIKDSQYNIGLFAKQDILPNTTIWEFTKGFDRYIHKSNLYKLNKIQKEFNHQHNYYMIYADNARFMNHSLSPNTYDVEGLTGGLFY